MPRQLAGMADAIGATSSIGRPVNRTVFAIARSSVSAEPARYGVPGNDTRPSAESSEVTLPIVYLPGAQPAAATASVTRIMRRSPFARTIAFTVAGGILAAIEVVDRRGLHVLSRMRAAGAILRRHVRSLHVNAGNGRTGHARQHARARRELLEARGDERRQAAGHAGAPHPLQRFA